MYSTVHPPVSVSHCLTGDGLGICTGFGLDVVHCTVLFVRSTGTTGQPDRSGPGPVVFRPPVGTGPPVSMPFHQQYFCLPA